MSIKSANDGNCPILAQGGLRRVPGLGGSVAPDARNNLFPSMPPAFSMEICLLGNLPSFLPPFITAVSSCGPGQPGHLMPEAQKVYNAGKGAISPHLSSQKLITMQNGHFPQNLPCFHYIWNDQNNSRE